MKRKGSIALKYGKGFLILLLVNIFTSHVSGYSNAWNEDVFADAPWRVDSNQNIPILLEVKDSSGGNSYDWTSVYIYDLNNNSASVKIYDNQGNNLENDLNGLLPTTIQQNLWYRVVYINQSELKLVSDTYTINVTFFGEYNISDKLNITYTGNSLPTLDSSSWFCGDTHFHSSYSDNFVEFGAPVNATVEAGKAIGLDWFALTDHSFDLDSEDSYHHERWKWGNLTAECNAHDSDVICLVGEEVTVINSRNRFVHLLVYNISGLSEAILGDGDGGWRVDLGVLNPWWLTMINNFGEYIDTYEKNNDSNEDGIDDRVITHNLSTAIDMAKSVGGFAYYAHPKDMPPWDNWWGMLNSSTGDFFNYEGLRRDGYYQPDYDLLGYMGLQVWNGDANISMEKLDQGLIEWKNQLQKNFSRKIFVEGGTDAHGDFNYMRTILGEDYTSSFGRVRTCCYMTSFSRNNVYNALRQGNCFMTDGPALSFKVNNRKIGENLTVDTGSNVSLFIEWNSTAEFGPLSSIRVYKSSHFSWYDSALELLADSFSPNNLSGSKTYSNVSSEEWLEVDEDSYFRVEGVTSTGKRVYTNPIWVNTVSAPYIVLVKHVINPNSEVEAGTGQDCLGGESECAVDGNFNTGETAEFDLYVKNIGKATAQSLRMNITSSASCVNSLNENTNIVIGDLNSGNMDSAPYINLTTKYKGVGTCAVESYQDFNVTLWDNSGRVWKHTFTVRMDNPNWESIYGHQIDSFYTNESIKSNDQLYIFINFSNNNGISTSDKPIVYYKCGIASVDDNELGYDGSAVMTNYSCCGYQWKAHFNGVSEKCEGKKLYWRARVKDTQDNKYYWSSSETVDSVGVVSDEDTTPPSFSSLQSSGNINPNEFYEFNVTLSDALSGILDSNYYPLVYYRWDNQTVNETVYDGMLDLDYVGSIHTAKFNVSERYENKTLYWRVLAGDNDNTPAFSWSSVQTGGTIKGIKPSTPVMYNTSTSYTRDYYVNWSDSADGSGIKLYELNETFNGSTQTYYTNSSIKDFTNKGVGNYTYSARAQDNAGNWGNWSNTVIVTVESPCTGVSPPSSGDWNVSANTTCNQTVINLSSGTDVGTDVFINENIELFLNNSTLYLDPSPGDDAVIWLDGILKLLDSITDWLT